MANRSELSRPFSLRGNRHKVLTEHIDADEGERVALAQRLSIPEIIDLTCRLEITPQKSDQFLIEGILTCHVVLECVITGENFEDALSEHFFVRLVPEQQCSAELTHDLEAIDEIGYTHGTIDLGDLVAEQLALVVPAYPRKAGAGLPQVVDTAPRDDGQEKQSGAFAALNALAKQKKSLK